MCFNANLDEYHQSMVVCRRTAPYILADAAQCELASTKCVVR